LAITLLLAAISFVHLPLETAAEATGKCASIQEERGKTFEESYAGDLDKLLKQIRTAGKAGKLNYRPIDGKNISKITLRYPKYHSFFSNIISSFSWKVLSRTQPILPKITAEFLGALMKWFQIREDERIAEAIREGYWPADNAHSWFFANNFRFADESVGAVCINDPSVDPNAGQGIILPWRQVNYVEGRFGYMREWNMLDVETGGRVVGKMGFAAGGFNLKGVGDGDQPGVEVQAELTCPVGSLAFFFTGKLDGGVRDDYLSVNVRPPGGFYREISGPEGGLKAEAFRISCPGSGPAHVDLICGEDREDVCTLAAGNCGVIYSMPPGSPLVGESLSAVCAVAFGTIANPTKPERDTGLWACDSLAIIDAVKITSRNNRQYV